MSNNTDNNDNNNNNNNQEETQTDPPNEMKLQINPSRAKTLVSNIEHIQKQIHAAITSTNTSTNNPQSTSKKREVRLVAVSKLKPATDILSLYKEKSHRHFGENYVQELLEKSKLLPHDIKWHFIGGLQSNKCVQLARDVPGLWAVESVDSLKKAKLLNKGRQEGSEGSEGSEGQGEQEKEKLRVYIQINTSGEESKSGIPPNSKDLLELARYIRSDSETPFLQLAGLMTIGAIARSQASTKETENEDFVCLRECRSWLVDRYNSKDEANSEDTPDQELREEDVELSMGMSSDFEAAIHQGSDEVRVGSTIFGERPAKKDAKVVEDVEVEKS